MRSIPFSFRLQVLLATVNTTISRRASVSIGIHGAMVAHQFAAAMAFIMTVSCSKYRYPRDYWTDARLRFRCVSVLSLMRQATFFRELLRWRVHSPAQRSPASGLA